MFYKKTARNVEAKTFRTQEFHAILQNHNKFSPQDALFSLFSRIDDNDETINRFIST